jgi:hypothetical protein
MWLTALLGLASKIPTTVFSLFTGINFGSLLAGVGTFFTGLIKNIETYWYFWLIAVLVAGNLFTGWGWQHTKGQLIQEKAAHAADIASYKKAQADANAKAQQERAILQKESKADADQADANYSGLLARYRASLMRYSQTSASAAGKPGDNQLSTTQGGDGPGSSSQLPTTLTISGADADICAVNTARLEAVHDWAITLPKEATQP